jgi:hypothetical protein
MLVNNTRMFRHRRRKYVWRAVMLMCMGWDSRVRWRRSMRWHKRFLEWQLGQHVEVGLSDVVRLTGPAVLAVAFRCFLAASWRVVARSEGTVTAVCLGLATLRLSPSGLAVTFRTLPFSRRRTGTTAGARTRIRLGARRRRMAFSLRLHARSRMIRGHRRHRRWAGWLA